MKPATWISGAVCAGALGIVLCGAGIERGRTSPRGVDPRDPALVRREILARLDAAIDAQAAQAHLSARLAVDQAMPIPYLGLDLETVDRRSAKIIDVYPKPPRPPRGS